MQYSPIEYHSILTIDEFIEKFPNIKEGDELSEEIINNAVSTIIDEYNSNINKYKTLISKLYIGIIALKFDMSITGLCDSSYIDSTIEILLYLNKDCDFKYYNPDKLCEEVYAKYVESWNLDLPNEIIEECKPIHFSDLKYYFSKFAEWGAKDSEFLNRLQKFKELYYGDI